MKKKLYLLFCIQNILCKPGLSIQQQLAKLQQNIPSMAEKIGAQLAQLHEKINNQPPTPTNAAQIIASINSAQAHTTEPKIVTPAPAPAQPVSSHEDKTELEWTLLKSITATLTPLMTAYPTEKLIPIDPSTRSFDEQLDQMHIISTFLTKLKIKLELLSPESREFIKTASFFEGNPVARTLARNLLSLQSFFESQLAAYKAVKPQSTIVKELKKMTTGCAKEVDTLCKELFNA